MVSATSRITISFALLALIVIGGVLGVMATEGLSLPDAAYFVIVTIATVGYGDIVPQTGAGRLVAALLIIAGVGTFVSVFATVVESFVSRNERRARRRKITMIVGAFYSEAGTEILRAFARLDPEVDAIQENLDVRGDDFVRVRQCFEEHRYGIDGNVADLAGLQILLEGKKEYLLRLMENPAIFEHDAFTDLLYAVFHLREELMLRDNLAALPDADRAHLASDISRAYRHLALEWLGYLQHLRTAYPYIFSLAVRRNPFDDLASATIR
ncbi:two pore domain potassium channel family protein [Methanoculleus sp. FWC-SCC1]|uniref:Two pore domain potassium channel family protein n=1 Tax=Methanoculleus frigidifontis TaxID=2584085 RepID=A0ABT8M708_9EURY|nr:potassium channel family protein [Methanoculleus sp. FWC-SCC1]MDN7023710.1 two pore domain potassium channel family protein [Methanoculleus sp. FWC-SCC1]